MGVRTKEEILKDIDQIEKELQRTPDGSPNIGHLATMLVGLRGELHEATTSLGHIEVD